MLEVLCVVFWDDECKEHVLAQDSPETENQ